MLQQVAADGLSERGSVTVATPASEQPAGPHVAWTMTVRALISGREPLLSSVS
jgi:hypothetical protein